MAAVWRVDGSGSRETWDSLGERRGVPVDMGRRVGSELFEGDTRGRKQE